MGGFVIVEKGTGWTVPREEYLDALLCLWEASVMGFGCLSAFPVDMYEVRER
jgi:hypothetical protein